MPLLDSSHAKKKKFISVIMQRWQSLKKIVVAPEIKKVYMIPDVLMRWDEQGYLKAKADCHNLTYSTRKSY